MLHEFLYHCYTVFVNRETTPNSLSDQTVTISHVRTPEIIARDMWKAWRHHFLDPGDPSRLIGLIVNSFVIERYLDSLLNLRSLDTENTFRL